MKVTVIKFTPLGDNGAIVKEEIKGLIGIEIDLNETHVTISNGVLTVRAGELYDQKDYRFK